MKHPGSLGEGDIKKYFLKRELGSRSLTARSQRFIPKGQASWGQEGLQLGCGEKGPGPLLPQPVRCPPCPMGKWEGELQRNGPGCLGEENPADAHHRQMANGFGMLRMVSTKAPNRQLNEERKPETNLISEVRRDWDETSGRLPGSSEREPRGAGAGALTLLRQHGSCPWKISRPRKPHTSS